MGEGRVDDVDRTMALLSPEDRRSIERLSYELAHLEDRLTKQTSVEELEAEKSSTGKPFGNIHDEWLALKAHIQEGDELWYWTTSEETWSTLCGRAGVALVREKKVIGSLITDMN